MEGGIKTDQLLISFASSTIHLLNFVLTISNKRKASVFFGYIITIPANPSKNTHLKTNNLAQFFLFWH